jgi:hypothetical protein
MFIVGQLSSMLHMALVRHRFCPLHGLEDVHVLDPAAVHNWTDNAVIPMKTPAARPASPVEVSHETCVLVSVANEVWCCPRIDAADNIAAPAATLLAVAVYDDALPSGRTPLDFAPKIGPPA